MWINGNTNSILKCLITISAFMPGIDYISRFLGISANEAFQYRIGIISD